jgi:phosphoglucomutase
MLIDVAALERAYYENRPDLSNPAQRVAFGTSGHRGTPFDGSFTEAHILATTQAICDYRRANHLTGPLFMGKDSHAVSDAAQRTALEVLAANDVETFIQRDAGCAPTPVISRAILTYNRGRKDGLADGVVITPSHNPPADGGFKYNPPTGGPADTDLTKWIQDRANDLLRGGNKEMKRVAYESALKASTTRLYDYVPGYVDDVANAIDLALIRSAGIKLGVDPLGGASLAY